MLVFLDLFIQSISPSINFVKLNFNVLIQYVSLTCSP